ncbi:MAG TPA: histidine phosphatase family protein [Bryobacteraceae bacterium]|nr:histidine phosphatase family protein [Bryobacteraceae bacterium]
MSCELWLIRHGETEWSLSGQHTSRTDLPLLPEGEQRAGALREILAGKNFARVLSSPMRRAIDTARLAGFTPQPCADLREWQYGDYEGLTTAQIRQFAPDWSIWTSNPPNGETADRVAARADRVISEALLAPGSVALFGHGHMLRVLAARWLDLPPQCGRFFSLSTASVSVLAIEHEMHVIRLWNRVA